LAKAAGGEGAAFLSQEYRGSSLPHTWRCGRGGGERGGEGGHVFVKTPNYVRKGLLIGRAFCRECEREKRRAREGGKEGEREGGREGKGSLTAGGGREGEGKEEGRDES